MARKKTITYYQGVGRRKRSTATARLFAGKGELVVNNKPIKEYFLGAAHAEVAYLAPLIATANEGKFDGTIKVSGGGVFGQLGAIKLALARALTAYNEEHQLILRKRGMLTRDPREKERKKYNLHKARRAHQFSKR